MNLTILKKISISLLFVCLAGCASDHAFVKAKTTLEQGDVNAGLDELKALVSKYPANVEYKRYYYKRRDAIISQRLQEADNARVKEQWRDATAAYTKVLDVDKQNARAKEGLAVVELAKKNAIKIQEAETLLKNGEFDAANHKIKQVLKEQPANKTAKKLLARIAKKRSQNSNFYTQVSSKFKKPISLELRDANIKTVFQLLSKAAGVNFILDKEIKPDTKVSIFVKNTTIDEALNNIFSTSQLNKKVLNENSVLVYPNSKKSDYEESVAKTFYLDNVGAKKAEELIKTVIKTKDIFIDEDLNILVMRDTPDAIRLAEKLINSYDVGDPEVLLEVEILEISDTRASELGLRWPSQLSVGVTGAAGAGQLTFDEVNNFKSNMARLSITDPTLILNLRSTNGVSNLLANPRIRVKNHKKAKVHIGDRVPVITSTSTATGFVSETVSYLDVGLKLDVEPSITISDEVSIEVGLEVSNIVSEIVTSSGSLSYRLGTRNANTTLRLKDGETQVLAGLINNEERSSADNVPGLANLPIIGRLFSSRNRTNTKTEIVLLITPRIIRNLSAMDAVETEFSLGAETGNARASMSSGVSTGVVNSRPAVDNAVRDSVEDEARKLTPAPIAPIRLNIPAPPPLPSTSPEELVE